MTHPARTSFTPSIPPLPYSPPASPLLPQSGAIGRRMLARKWMKSEFESPAWQADLSLRLEVEASGGISGGALRAF